MSFTDNLHYLRKRDKVTQEELADRLGVSRQSVSKWETGEAYPETDKLISICDIFGVSLDDLLRNDLTASEAVDETSDEKSDEEEKKVFIGHMNKFSLHIALGVFLVLFGVGVCMVLTAQNGNLFDILGGVAVILFVAAAVFLFVFAGIEHDRFQKAHTEVKSAYLDAQILEFGKRFAVGMASLICGILLDVVFLVTLTSLIDEGIITCASKDAAYCYVVAAFFGVLAFIVGGIVYLGIQHSKYHVEEYNRQSQEEVNPTKSQKLKGGLCGIIMLVATAVFLLLGFICELWHPAWVAFPIGGILCAIVSIAFDSKRS